MHIKTLIIKVWRGVWGLSHKLSRVSRFCPWNVLISSNANIFAKLPQSSYEPKLTFSDNFTFLEFIIPKLLSNSIYFSEFKKTNNDIFRELLSIYTYFSEFITPIKIHINHYWQIKIFSELLSKNINIFWESVSNSTDFFRVYVNYFQINCTKQSSKFTFILINWDICTKCLFPQYFGHTLGLKS